MVEATIKKWADFQHYKNRCPPWIKLQKSILDDFEFACLPLASKALAPMLWLLASESMDGSVRIDPEWLAFRLRFSEADVRAGLAPLIDKGFLILASGVLADCLQLAPKNASEAEAEAEAEAEKDLPPTAGVEPPDPIFGDGLAFLVGKGVKEKPARSFLGMLRKELGDITTAELLAKAETDDVSEPLAWLRAASTRREKAKSKDDDDDYVPDYMVGAL